MPIYQQGQLNTTALVVPDVAVVIVPPHILQLNGVPSNVVGVVGTAPWGPVDQPVIVGDHATYVSAFGPVSARKHDMGTVVATAVQQGAQSFRCVRVTDNTDAAASAVLAAGVLSGAAAFWANVAAAVNGGSSVLRAASQLVRVDATAGTITAVSTGSVGNGIVASVAKGSKAGTFRLVLSLAGRVSEVFDNIPAAAGQLPALAAYPLSGGTDGAAGVDAAALVGDDGSARTGMFALRGQGCSVVALADADDLSKWSAMAQFGYGEGAYVLAPFPAGTDIQAAIAGKAAAGVYDWSLKCLFGWLWWYDATNGATRMVSPQGFVAGLMGNLSPEQSTLNKRLYSVVGSERSGIPGAGTSGTYSEAELSALIQAGIDLVTNPAPGGAYWACRSGHNSSSDATRSGDNYTRLTIYIAKTLNATMGKYVGRVINDGLFADIRSTQLTFLSSMLGQGLLGSQGGDNPFSVRCDAGNNPQARTALGYVQSDASVRYQGINEHFIVNLEGGASVQIVSQGLTYAAA